MTHAQHEHTIRSFARQAEMGFTLLELMIVVVVAAILAILAVMSYQFAVIKSRRATAESCLVERAQYMERFYTTNLRYDQDSDGNAVTLPAQSCTVELAGFYTFDFSAGPTASSYTLRASPVAGKQKDSKCGVLTLTNSGVKAPANPDDCW